MIPSWVTQLGTVAALAVGFGLGWFWRGWRDTQLFLDELARHGIDPNDLKW